MEPKILTDHTAQDSLEYDLTHNDRRAFDLLKGQAYNQGWRAHGKLLDQYPRQKSFEPGCKDLTGKYTNDEGVTISMGFTGIHYGNFFYFGGQFD